MTYLSSKRVLCQFHFSLATQSVSAIPQTASIQSVLCKQSVPMSSRQSASVPSHARAHPHAGTAKKPRQKSRRPILAEQNSSAEKNSRPLNLYPLPRNHSSLSRFELPTCRGELATGQLSIGEERVSFGPLGRRCRGPRLAGAVALGVGCIRREIYTRDGGGVVLVVLAGKGTVRVKASQVWVSAMGRGPGCLPESTVHKGESNRTSDCRVSRPLRQ
jgi:hypothetical protein